MVDKFKVRLDVYTHMVTSGYWEVPIANIYTEGKQPGFDTAEGSTHRAMHRSNGQEPVGAGVCAHLECGDVVTAPRRHHHIEIAKYVDLKRMSVEISGHRKGPSGDRCGHMQTFGINVN